LALQPIFFVQLAGKCPISHNPTQQKKATTSINFFC